MIKKIGNGLIQNYDIKINIVLFVIIETELIEYLLTDARGSVRVEFSNLEVYFFQRTPECI